jgi:hypothetical protein
MQAVASIAISLVLINILAVAHQGGFGWEM